MPIEIIVAKPSGFCGNKKFGVRGAIFKAIQASKQYPGKTYLLGEIVHNSHVVKQLEQEFSIKTVQTISKIPKDSTVVLRAHGSTPSIYQQAKKQKLIVVDATCPLVSSVQEKAKKLASEGKQVVYLASSPNHDEAISVYHQAPDSIILTTLDKIHSLSIDDPENTVVLTQTTLSTLETEVALSRLKKNYPGLTIVPHICPATTARQKAVIELAKKIGFVIIVGHPTSSNSNRLREVAQDSGAKAYIVDTENELEPDWFIGKTKVVVSSGASTPDWLTEKVIEKIKTITSNKKFKTQQTN